MIMIIIRECLKSIVWVKLVTLHQSMEVKPII